MWLELIRVKPALAAVLLDCVRSGLVPGFSRAQVESGDLSEHAPAAYHADAVVTLGDDDPALAVLPEAARRILEAMVKTKDGTYKSELFRTLVAEGEARGEAKGMIEMILAVLAARGVTMPEEVRTRLVECGDLEQLATWGRRAATASCIEDIFDQRPSG